MDAYKAIRTAIRAYAEPYWLDNCKFFGFVDGGDVYHILLYPDGTWKLRGVRPSFNPQEVNIDAVIKKHYHAIQSELYHRKYN